VLSDAAPDGDVDGVPDAIDNCVDMPNADQTSDDGMRGNACGGARDDLGATSMLLAAVHPAIAEAGDVVTLEGRFEAGAMVRFPGSAQPVAPSGIAGTGRLQATVPADATVGDLVVVSGGARSNGVPFRRTTYAIELQPFSTAFSQTVTARAMPRPQAIHDRLIVAGNR
jgi:hypothetical protein